MAGFDMRTQRATLEIEGLGCGGGGALIAERALARMKGVRRAYVNPATEMAYVEYEPDQVDPSTLVRAVEATGLRASTPVGR
jgi:cation transport ATPase